MSLQIQMVGTGSAFAKNYYNTSALIIHDRQKVLIDCGYSTPQSLYQLGIAPDQLDGIIITHIHADHVFGLEEIAFRLFYDYNKKRIKLFVTQPVAETLWEHTLKGGMYNPSAGCVGLSDYFEVVIVEASVPTPIFPGLHIEMIQTPHIPDKPSYSIFINHHAFYSADIQFDRSLIVDEVVGRRKCTVIFHDCQLSGTPMIHATLDQLLTLPDDIQQRIYLMHYNDTMESYIGKTGRMTFVRQHQIVNLSE